MFNHYNERVIESRNAVNSHIMYLLEPDVAGFPKVSDARLKQLYEAWCAECREMDAACQENWNMAARHKMIEMPRDDKEHFLCRRAAAVIIERNIRSEYHAKEYLGNIVEKLMQSNCWSHPKTCACQLLSQTKHWSYANQLLIDKLAAHYREMPKLDQWAFQIGRFRPTCF
jgi:hypothetical protein